MVFTWVFLTISAVLAAMSIRVLFGGEDQQPEQDKPQKADSQCLASQPLAPAVALREEVRAVIKADPALVAPVAAPIVKDLDPDAEFHAWFRTPGGYTYVHLAMRYWHAAEGLLEVPEDSEMILRQTMTETEFFQLFLKTESTTLQTDGAGDGLPYADYCRGIGRDIARIAIRMGYSPKAVYDYVQFIKQMKPPQRWRFYSRLASFMRIYNPIWGDVGERKTSGTKLGNNRSHASHLS